jgi:hypothetical protein
MAEGKAAKKATKALRGPGEGLSTFAAYDG